MMAELVLQLIQRTPGEKLTTIQDDNAEQDHKLKPWQMYFSGQFSDLFKQDGKIRFYKVQAEFIANLVLIQQTGKEC